MLFGAAGAVVLAAVLVVGIPWILEALNTVSTDDAFVNGHVTFVAARVRGQVARVLVDDNNRVHRGDLLVELDKEPYQTAVAVKKAVVDTATADLVAATATVRGIEAEARSRRWKLQHAMEDVANQIAELDTRVAGVDKSKAALTLAELEFERARQLVASNNIPRSEFDRRQATLVELPHGLSASRRILRRANMPSKRSRSIWPRPKPQGRKPTRSAKRL